MAVLSLTDCFLHVSNQDYTTDTNAANVSIEAAQLDATTFNSGGWTELAGGLKTVNLAYSGFWSSGADQRAYIDVDGATTRAVTFGPVETEGSPAYMFEARNTNYTMGGQVGELMPFSVSAVGSSSQGVVRGQLAKAKGNVSGTGALGTGVNLGAVSSTQFLYATFHVFSPPGTSITIQVQSDDNSGFTTATTVATIGPLTAVGGTWMTRVAGPITDTWYRFNVSSITGTFSVAGALGIG